MVGAVVGGTFDAVIFCEVSFDDTRIGAVASFEVGDLDDFFDRFVYQLVESMRGENPLAR
ncbi:MAG: hypothetical protein ACJ72N_05610 [Labedaea sp.]